MLSFESDIMEEYNNKDIEKKQQTNRHSQSDKIKTIYYKSALLFSILIFIIVLILFYSLNRNMQGITDKMHHIDNVLQQSKLFSKRLSTITKRIEKLENDTAQQTLATDKLRTIIRDTLVEQATRQLEYVLAHLQTQASDDDLRTAIILLQKNKKGQQKNDLSREPEPIP